MTLDGDQLGEFTAAAEDSAPAAYSEGFDDVVFFCLPDPATGEVHLPVAAPGGGLAHPPGGAALVREYTVRSLRDGALCVDLVRHASGAGAHWLEGPARRRYPDRPARGLPAGTDRKVHRQLAPRRAAVAPEPLPGPRWEGATMTRLTLCPDRPAAAGWRGTGRAISNSAGRRCASG